jgi:hypothetical protein
MYKYEFDHTTVGDFRFSRKDYELIQEGLRLLREKLLSWEQLARSHGATRSPYKRELRDLEGMIFHWEERLQDKAAREIGERGLSVGTLRYIKAALLHAARCREQEIAEAAQTTWPSAITKTLEKQVELLENTADGFSVEPAAILNELEGEYELSKSAIAPVLIKEDLQAQRMLSKDTEPTEEWDAFVSHASEDKESFVRPLAEALQSKGLRIWYDEFTLTVGDSLRRSIDRGLARSRFGIVVLSPNFFAKEWPQKELDGLVAREVNGQKVILPVWHGVDAEAIRKVSPMLADRVAATSAIGIDAVVKKLIKAMSGTDLVGYTLPVAAEQKPLTMSVDRILQLIGDSDPSDWTYYDPKAKYYYKRDVQLTIDRHPADKANQFAEKWAHKFPDQSAHAVTFTVHYGATPIKDFWAVEVDGGRSYIPYPKSADVLTINRWEYAVGQIINIANGTYSFPDYFQRAGFTVVDE